MPRRSRAPVSKKQNSAARTLDAMRDRLLDIEAPLRDATEYVQALQLIGQGLVATHDDAGEPVVAVACAAAERLEQVKTIWDEVFEIGRRRR
jgi:hypothetical protein